MNVKQLQNFESYLELLTPKEVDSLQDDLKRIYPNAIQELTIEGKENDEFYGGGGGIFKY